MIDNLEKVTVITGHYGSGKTNFAVNLAIDLRRAGKKVVLVDLDIVNPYFRSADFKNKLEGMGIQMVCPIYANTNLDLPSLGPEVYSVFASKDDRYVILDVGGDDAGAAALGRYAQMINEHPWKMIYVINRYRYLTREPQQAVEIMREIEMTSRLTVTSVVNNSNLGSSTTKEDILSSFAFGEETANLAGVELLGSSVRRDLAEQIERDDVYPVDIHILPPWEL